MSAELDAGATVTSPLSNASVDRLASLLRHWTWTDQAKAAFDRELADGWNDDDDPMSDRPFGSYYHWCALLCAFAEATLAHGLLSRTQLEPIQHDLEASLPRLRSCRRLIVVIPSALEDQPRLEDLLRDGETVPRLQRLHQAFGDALRSEQVSRAIDSLDH